MPGELPEISWETSKVIDADAEKEEGAATGSTGGTTIPVEKGKEEEKGKGREKKPQLDVFTRAAASRKPVFLYFTAKECAPCRTMEKLMMRQKAVVEEAKKFHSVMIATDYVKRDLLDEYKVKEAPTIILFDYEGKARRRLVGRQSNKTIEAAFKEVAKANTKLAEEKAPEEKTDAKKAGEKSAPKTKQKAKKKAAEKKAEGASDPEAAN